MRICFFADGRSIHAQRWLDAVVADGIEVHLACWDGYTGSNEGIAVHDLRALAGRPFSGMIPRARAIEWVWRARSAARRVVRQVHPDLVHGHFVRGYGHLAMLSGVRPFVVTAWGSDIYDLADQGWLSRALTRRTLRTADLVTCDSQDLWRRIVALGTSPSRVQIVPFGVDTDMFAPNANSISVESLSNVDDDARIVLAPRALAPKYCTTTLIRAFGRVVAEEGNAVLVLAGPSADPSYAREVSDLSFSLGLENRVFNVGEQPHSSMPALYARADAVVSLAKSDSSPVSVLEAMSSGAIIVASDLPGVREWIKNGENGFLSDPDNEDRLVAGVRGALSLDDAERARWGSANRAMVAARADSRVAARTMAREYERLTTERDVSSHPFQR